jgi:hypothetical protein
MSPKSLRLLPLPVTEPDPPRDPPHVVENMELRTSQYIEVRDAIAKLEEAHEEALKPFLEVKELLAAKIQKFMNDNNLENLKTAAGTCYVKDHYTASVMDGEAFMSLVQEGHWDLIERRANSTAVREWVETNKELPAGVNLTVRQNLGVRRPTTKK